MNIKTKFLLFLLALITIFSISIIVNKESFFPARKTVKKEKAKIAFITAIFGEYEKTCKTPAEQTIPADFICFTDNKNIKSKGWEIDNQPYHLTHKSALDTGEYINSIENNKHTFNLAKYYKQAFYNIPRLKDYDIIVWLDGTVEIQNPKTAEWVVKQIETSPIIT